MRGSSRAGRRRGGATRTRRPESGATGGLSRGLLPAAGLVVAFATLAVYAPVAHFDFVMLDDDVYVTANRRVQAGLTADGIVWAFTTGHSSFWQPLTWLSHM